MTILVNVASTIGGAGWSGTFGSQDEANAWIADQVAQGTWGDPSTYTITQTDTTLETQALADEQTGAAAMAIGQRVIARLYAINLRKGFTTAQLMTMLADQQLAIAERLLRNGAPETAKTIIQTTGPTYYTADELATILAPIG